MIAPHQYTLNCISVAVKLTDLSLLVIYTCYKLGSWLHMCIANFVTLVSSLFQTHIDHMLLLSYWSFIENKSMLGIRVTANVCYN